MASETTATFDLSATQPPPLLGVMASETTATFDLSATQP